MNASVCRVPLTNGNVNNHHFYLRSCAHLIPDGGVGGKNKSEAGASFTVTFDPGMTVETDVDGAKMILRDRSGVRDFFKRSGAAAGDDVILERTGPRSLLVRLQPMTP